MSIKLKDVYKIEGIINCLTGLRVGGTGGVIKIGGVDNPIIRDAITQLPYIPGSSLKGKMRSLLELQEGKISENGGPCTCGESDCFVCRIFGTSAGEKKESFGPTRLIVRDAYPTDESIESLKDLRIKHGLDYAEVKSENTLNRVTARATPRRMERVPAGIKFGFEIVYRIFDTGDGGKTDEDNLEHVRRSLRLVENDALGGSGSRGYGKVKFDGLKLIKEDGSVEDFVL